MRIIWLMPECPIPANTGGRLVEWNRLRYFAKNNEIHLFVTVDSEKELDMVKKLEVICHSVHMYIRKKSVKKIIKSLWYPFPAVSRWSQNMKKDIEECYKEDENSMIMIEFPQMIGNLSDVVRKSNNIILNQHNIEFMSMRSIGNNVENLIKKMAYKIVSSQLERYEKNIYKQGFVKLYTFVSIEDKKYFEKQFRCSNTLLVPIGANVCDEIANKSNRNVCFIAKMSYQPNADGAEWLIKRVWHNILNEVEDAKLYIVGKDPSEKLEKLASNNNNVIVTGTVDDVDEYYDKCSVVVVPILSGGGVKVKLLEGLGHGKFVVTTRKGIEGTEFENSVHLLAEDNPKLFAKQCIELLKYPENYNYLKVNSKQIMTEKYSWDGILGMFEIYVEKLCYENKEA